MLKKRIIFTLMFKDNNFYLSRNFRLQKIGSLKWLKKNYDFSSITKSIDEIILLNVSQDKKQLEIFCNTIEEITKECFIPIAVGGGIDNLEMAKKYIEYGADKLVINTNLLNKKLILSISRIFGEQCIVGSIDLRIMKNKYCIFTQGGKTIIYISLKDVLKKINTFPVGEILINSIDKDGTGNGYDFNILKFFPKGFNKPIILSGGAGNYNHILEALKKKNIDSIATSNLLNFVNNGFQEARMLINKNGVKLADWI